MCHQSGVLPLTPEGSSLISAKINSHILLYTIMQRDTTRIKVSRLSKISFAVTVVSFKVKKKRGRPPAGILFSFLFLVFVTLSFVS